MSLWYESLGSSCQSTKNDTEQIQELLRHLSMPVPKEWWQSCLDDKSQIENYSEYLLEFCDKITELQTWNHYGLFVALAFTGLDYITPFQYSIDHYLNSAKDVLKNQPKIKGLGDRVNQILQERKKVPTTLNSLGT